jgi:cobalt-zinc-cadmium efflux system outer membrane protein
MICMCEVPSSKCNEETGLSDTILPRARNQPMSRHASSAILALCLIVVPVAKAADAPPYPVLLKQSLASAPTLLEQAATVGAAGADARQAHAWRNPSIDALAENLNAPLAGGVSQRQTTYSITQPIELGGKRRARIEAGERGLAAAEAQQRQSEVEFAARLAVAYATAEAMQDRQALASEDVSRANEDLRAARALVKAGKEANLREMQALAGVSTAQAVEAAAIADTTESLEHLSALVGAEQPYTHVADSLLVMAPDAAAGAASARDAPSVVTAQAERDALAAQVSIERKKRIPDLDISAGVRKFGGSSDNALVVGISATIPLFDQNSGAIASARARADAADARLAAARFEAAASRRSAIAQATASEGRVAAAMQGEEAAAEAYRLGRVGYEAGRTSLVELLIIRRSLSEARFSTIEARLARVRALAALAQTNGHVAFGD